MTAIPAAPVDPIPIRAETPFDAAAIDALVLAAFGPGRFAKTAERLRERSRLAAGFVAHEGGRLVGSVRLWSITVGETQALFLGPIAVEANRRRGGLGAELVEACIAWAEEDDASGVLLVGDPPYFSRFGFEAAPAVRLEGPADPCRILWRGVGQAGVEGVARAGA